MSTSTVLKEIVVRRKLRVQMSFNFQRKILKSRFLKKLEDFQVINQYMISRDLVHTVTIYNSVTISDVDRWFLFKFHFRISIMTITKLSRLTKTLKPEYLGLIQLEI